MTNDFKGLMHEIRYVLDRYNQFKTSDNQNAMGVQTLTKLDAFLEADFDIDDFVKDEHIKQVSESKEEFVRIRMRDLLTMLKGLRILSTITEKEE